MYETDVLQKGPISSIGLQISVIICVTCYYLSNIKYLLSISLKVVITHKMYFKEVFYYKVMTSYRIIITRFMTHGSKFSLNYCCDLCLVHGPSVRQSICFNSLSRSTRCGLMKFCNFHINSLNTQY